MYSFNLMLIFSIFSITQEQNFRMTDIKTSCFSEANFEIVYAYVEKHVEESKQGPYSFDDIELNLVDGCRIYLKKNNYTIAIFDKEKGIYSMAKVLEDNKRLVKKANEIFCDLLSEAR